MLDILEYFNIIVYGLVALLVLASIIIKRFGLLRYRYPKSYAGVHGSILLALYVDGHSLQSLVSGEIGKISYRTYVTTPASSYEYSEPVFNSGAIIYVLELDFNTQAHIVGLGKEAFFDGLQLKSHFNTYHLEPVVLEGDFHHHFELYASEGQQTKVRYIFDPEAMQSFMRYCKYNFWEIVGDEMIIVVSKNHRKSSGVLRESEEFISQIRPALIRTFPGEAPVKHDPSYGIYKGPPLPCPLCGTKMTLDQNIHICPMGHGILLYGKELMKLNHGKISVNIPTYKTVDHGKILCPNCKSEMINSQYQGSYITIDTCQKCVFRWLDSKEVAEITLKNT